MCRLKNQYERIRKFLSNRLILTKISYSNSISVSLRFFNTRFRTNLKNVLNLVSHKSVKNQSAWIQFNPIPRSEWFRLEIHADWKFCFYRSEFGLIPTKNLVSIYSDGIPGLNPINSDWFRLIFNQFSSDKIQNDSRIGWKWFGIMRIG